MYRLFFLLMLCVVMLAGCGIQAIPGELQGQSVGSNLTKTFKTGDLIVRLEVDSTYYDYYFGGIINSNDGNHTLVINAHQRVYANNSVAMPFYFFLNKENLTITLPSSNMKLKVIDYNVREGIIQVE